MYSSLLLTVNALFQFQQQFHVKLREKHGDAINFWVLFFVIWRPRVRQADVSQNYFFLPNMIFLLKMIFSTKYDFFSTEYDFSAIWRAWSPFYGWGLLQSMESLYLKAIIHLQGSTIMPNTKSILCKSMKSLLVRRKLLQREPLSLFFVLHQELRRTFAKGVTKICQICKTRNKIKKKKYKKIQSWNIKKSKSGNIKIKKWSRRTFEKGVLKI